MDSLLDFDLISFEDEVIDEEQNNESIDFDLSTIATKTEKLNKTLERFASNNLKISRLMMNLNRSILILVQMNLKEMIVDESDLTFVNDAADDNYQYTDSLNDKSYGLNISFA